MQIVQAALAVIEWLTPRFRFEKGTETEASWFGFNWLWLSVWSLEHFAFQIDASLAIDRIGIGFIVPYVRVWIGVNDFWLSEREYWKWHGLTSRSKIEPPDFDEGK